VSLRRKLPAVLLRSPAVRREAYIATDLDTALERLQGAVARRLPLPPGVQSGDKPLVGEIKGQECRLALAAPTAGGHTLEPTFIGRLERHGGGVRLVGGMRYSSRFRLVALIGVVVIAFPLVNNIIALASGRPSDISNVLVTALPMVAITVIMGIVLQRLGARDTDRLWATIVGRIGSMQDAEGRGNGR
jgi:hypothetical protein